MCSTPPRNCKLKKLDVPLLFLLFLLFYYALPGIPATSTLLTLLTLLLRFAWNSRDESWIAVETIRGKRPLTFRVTLPTRTEIHDQAAVHTLWTPGSPTLPDQEAIRLYGFRKKDNEWQCTGTAGHESPYEITGE